MRLQFIQNSYPQDSDLQSNQFPREERNFVFEFSSVLQSRAVSFTPQTRTVSFTLQSRAVYFSTAESSCIPCTTRSSCVLYTVDSNCAFYTVESNCVFYTAESSCILYPAESCVLCTYCRLQVLDGVYLTEVGTRNFFFSPQSQFRNLKEAHPQSQFRNF